MYFSKFVLNWFRRKWHNCSFQKLFFLVIFILALDSINTRLFAINKSQIQDIYEKLEEKQTKIVKTFDEIAFNDGTGNNNITKALYSSMKILCIINSSKREILNRAQHIHKTWAKRCDKHIFLSQKHEFLTLPFIDVKVPETRPQLWNKIRAALKWAYDTELDNFDFFLRADDDSYFVMENLRFMLLPFDPNEALYFGARLKVDVPKGFMSGGAGVILSREALKRIVPHLWSDRICPQPKESVNDDLELGMCAQNLNITYVDTRDNLTFECCAEHMISFHYVYSEMLYVMEFLIYHSRLIGIVDNQWLNTLNHNKQSNMSVKELLKIMSIKVFQNDFLDLK